MDRKGMRARSSVCDEYCATNMLAGSTSMPINAIKSPALSDGQENNSSTKVGTELTTSSCPVLLTR